MKRTNGDHKDWIGGNADERGRRLTIMLGAPLAFIVSAIALFQFL